MINESIFTEEKNKGNNCLRIKSNSFDQTWSRLKEVSMRNRDQSRGI